MFSAGMTGRRYAIDLSSRVLLRAWFGLQISR